MTNFIRAVSGKKKKRHKNWPVPFMRIKNCKLRDKLDKCSSFYLQKSFILFNRIQQYIKERRKSLIDFFLYLTDDAYPTKNRSTSENF
jgi:hypothetical protein